jgi:glutamyl-tRNA synthetase
MVVRTRFAPSPTGDLHLGGARTALFAWLYAKRHGGQFVLRIEDTDRQRSTQASVDLILDAMAWLGLGHDEGPYYQTQRTDLYAQKLQQLLDDGKAYRCYCSKQRLDDLREAQMDQGIKPRYDGACRHLSESAKQGPFVVRFRQPDHGEVCFVDAVRGEITVSVDELDDMILARTDGSPTYNFTVVVDDADMNISHVLRGDDHISNTPRQIQLYQALGLPIPQFAHLSTILGNDGKRLSKRHGALSVLTYKDQGILPEALLNCLCRLGWSHGDQEVFTVDEMIALFDLDAVQKSPASFSDEKLLWLNQQAILSQTAEALEPLLLPYLHDMQVDAASIAAGASLVDVITLQQPRCQTLVAMAQQSVIYYKDLPAYDVQLVKGSLSLAARPYLHDLHQAYSTCDDWSSEAIHAVIAQVVDAHGVGFGKVGRPLRAAVTGGVPSGGLADVLKLVGKPMVLARIEAAMAWIDAQPAQ